MPHDHSGQPTLNDARERSAMRVLTALQRSGIPPRDVVLVRRPDTGPMELPAETADSMRTRGYSLYCILLSFALIFQYRVSQ